MKRVLLLLIILFSYLLLVGQGKNSYKVTKVFDGDTFEISTGEHVRLIGIDAPETEKDFTKGEFFAEESSKALEKLLIGKSVKLVYDIEKRDTNGRLLAYVYIEDGIEDLFVNAWLVKNGYAIVKSYPPNTKQNRLLQIYEEEAVNNKLGVWSRKSKNSGEYTGRVVSSRNSKVYHKPDCSNVKRIKESNKVWFKSLSEAQKAGKRPGKCCLDKKK